MLNQTICREHASKCIETAKTLPPGAQHEMFLVMATQWADVSARIEGSEALVDPASPPANDPGEPYRLAQELKHR